MSIERIASQQGSFQFSSSISQAGSSLAASQLTLSTGQRINSIADDPAGFSLANLAAARGGGLAQALANIGNASNVLNIASSGFDAISDLTQQISERAIQAADGALNDDQRSAIQGEIDALVAEIDDIARETTFQDQALIDGSFTGQSFQTGPDAGDTLEVSLGDGGAAALGLDDIDVTTQAGAQAAIDQAANAQEALISQAQQVGEIQTQLRAREDAAVTTAINTEAARSRIEDADLARERAEQATNQILTQASVAAQAQANASAEQILSLF